MLRARTFAKVAFIVSLTGCASPSRLAPRAQSLRTLLPPPRTMVGELDDRALLGDLPGRASQLGAGAPSLVASREAVEGDWVGGFVDVPKEECLLAYARGSSSIEDVDVVVYSEDGTTLAVDEGRDVHPTVLMCAPHPGRVYVDSHVVEGEGLVAIGAQIVPKDRALIVGRALGARGVPGREARLADAWPGLDDAVRARRVEFGGAWEELKRAALAVDSRMPAVESIQIRAGTCVDAVVVPDDDVALLDVEALDGQGRIVGRAKEGPGARALTVCSPIQISATLVVRPHVGQGLVAVVLARAPADVVRDSSARADVAWVASTRPLKEAQAARDAVLARSGYGAPVRGASGTLVLGRIESIPLAKGAPIWTTLGGGCARVDVVAGAPLSLLRASVFSEAGSLLASGDRAGSLALFVCAHGRATLELETRGRPGPFAVSLRPERWKGVAFAAHPLAMSRMFARAAAGPDDLLEGTALPVREISLDADHVSAWIESVPAQGCLRATVGAEGDGAGVELRVFGDDGDEIDRSEGDHDASVRTCASDAPRSVRFEVRASSGREAGVLGERVSAPSAAGQEPEEHVGAGDVDAADAKPAAAP